MSMHNICPACGAHLDWGERCDCGGVKTETLKTPRELIVDRMAYMAQAKAREKQRTQETLRKGIYTAICRQTAKK